MNETELMNLEMQIEALIYSKSQMKQENVSLRKQLTKMTQKHAQQLTKNEHATGKIKSIIKQLRNHLL